jgi:general secretion pathway protein B
MSSILKALEKVEDAQNQRRNPGAGGLGRKRERRPAWVIPAWSLGGAAVATLVTYTIMGGFGKQAPPAAPVVAAAPQPAAQAVAPAAKPVAPVAKAVPSPASAGIAAPAVPAPGKGPVKQIAPKHEQARHEAEAPVRKQQVAATPIQPAKPAMKKPLPVKIPAPPVPVRTATVHAAPVAAPVAAPPRPVAGEKPNQEIRVTGIAWQNDSQSSFAMVNGRPVRQGAVVDGYKVEQILENSVRFSGAKGSFTVPLGASEQ